MTDRGQHILTGNRIRKLTPLIPKPTTGQDPEPVPSFSYSRVPFYQGVIFPSLSRSSSGRFPIGFPIQIVYAFLSLHTKPVHRRLFNFTAIPTAGDEY